MQKLSKGKFQKKCQELGIGANQSLFFKKGFLQKFGCSPFCYVHSISTQSQTPKQLQSSFRSLCQANKEHLQNATHVLIHLQIDENFPFLAVEKMMEVLHSHLKDDTDVMMDIQYQKTTSSNVLYCFFEKE